MKELIGKRILKVEMSDDDQKIVFTLDNDGKLYRALYEAYGDCCSSTWFSHITGIKNLLNQTVLGISESEETLPKQEDAEKEGDYDVLALYGYDLRTEKGICTIEFRNDSNGYYGGSCEYVPFSEGVKLDGLREIAEDL